jgi:hypothetical protein
MEWTTGKKMFGVCNQSNIFVEKCQHVQWIHFQTTGPDRGQWQLLALDRLRKSKIYCTLPKTLLFKVEVVTNLRIETLSFLLLKLNETFI